MNPNRYYASGCLVIDSHEGMIVRYLRSKRDAILCSVVMNVREGYV
jgi:hypothetical protein